ncbi:MAG TPA: hypothetical protein H9837_05645 [Candidatus Brachybacterium merdigallinarum]|nr:hypothetical protein [Candidatus Brachybacterium merdigallinarum]
MDPVISAVDPRSRRTRARVHRTVLAAADGSEDLGALTVAELCRRAEVHRVTFYRHWPHLEAAIAEALTEIVDSLAEVDPATIAAAESPDQLAADYHGALVRQLEELARRRPVYQSLLTAATPFATDLEASLRRRAQLAIDAFGTLGSPVPGARDGTAAAYLAGGVAAAFTVFVCGEEEDLLAAADRISAQLPGWWPRRAAD